MGSLSSGDLARWLPRPVRRLEARWAGLVFAVAGLAHLVVFLAFADAWQWNDGLIHDEWDLFGRNLVDTGAIGLEPGVPSITRGPAFVGFTALLYLLFGTDYGSWSLTLMGYNLLSVMACTWMASALFDQRAGVVAGLLYGTHLPTIYYTGQIEQFTIVLPILFLWVYLLGGSGTLGRGSLAHAGLLGVVSGLLLLNKSVYLFFPLLAAAGVYFVYRSREAPRRRLLEAGAVLFAAFLVVAPWTARNYHVTGGKLIPVQTLLWTNVLADIHWDAYDREAGTDRPSGALAARLIERERAVVAERLPEAPSLRGPERELARERVFREASLEWILAHPVLNVQRIAHNVVQFWVGAENRSKVLRFALLQAPILLLALVATGVLIRRRARATLLLLLTPVVVVWGEYSLVYAMGRFSLDFIPLLALLVGVAASELSKPSDAPMPA